jgi:hypothetical protein
VLNSEGAGKLARQAIGQLGFDKLALDAIFGGLLFELDGDLAEIRRFQIKRSLLKGWRRRRRET